MKNKPGFAPRTTQLALALLLLSALSPLLSTCPAQGTAFTYQGRLNSAGTPASGNYDLTFTLFDSPTGGASVGGFVQLTAVPVTNGLFTVTINTNNEFGTTAFNGAARWLEIGVRTNNNAILNFTALTPRQQLTPTPYAIFAENVGSGGLAAGTYTKAVTFNNPANSFTGNGGGLTNVNAVTLGGLSASKFWQVGGNAGTTSASDFLGTTDGRPLQIRASGGVGIGTPSPLTPLHVVSSNNSIPQLQLTQDVTNNFTRLRMNVTGSPFWEMDVSSGATPSLSFWNGLPRMLVDYTGNVSAASFGYGVGAPTALHYVDSADGNKWKLRQGGADRVAVTTGGNVGIGTMSPVSPLHVASAGGTPQFHITQNTTNDYTRLRMNVGSWPSWEMDVSSGATPSLSFWNNTLRMILDYGGNLGLGTGSPDSPIHIVSGGSGPLLHLNQTTSGSYARLRLTVNDGNPWSVGVRDNGSYPGGLEFSTDSGASQMVITRAGAVYSIGGFNGSSDRNVKAGFEPVNAQAILEKVVTLPITRWHYTNDSATPHLGPVAQDFHAAFNVGPDDKHISTVDEGGVALAAIQGLNQKLSEQETRLKNKDSEIQELRQAVAVLQKTVSQITHKTQE